MACVLELSCLLNDIAIPHLGPGPTWPPARREKKERECETGVAEEKSEGREGVQYSLEAEDVENKKTTTEFMKLSVVEGVCCVFPV